MLADDFKTVSSSNGIVEVLFEAIRSGELAPGSLLPSIRDVATAAGVSPGTSALAFRVLRDRGVITTTHGRRAQVSVRPTLQRTIPMRVPVGVIDLATVGPDPQLLPDVQKILQGDVYRPILYDVENIESSLRSLMLDSFLADGIDGELNVTSGALDALERMLAVRLKPSETIIVEDPTWGASLSLLRAMGLDVISAPIDDEGVTPEGLERALATRRCSALLVTTRAQNPYGSAMSESRVAALSGILTRYPKLFIIEDDHAGPISGVPAATLTRDREHWAVIRSMNKTLGPDLRVAVTASDQSTANQVQARQLLGPGWVSHFTQRAVAQLLTQPQAVAQVETAARIYAERRESLMSALAARGVAAHGRSGLNVLVEVPDESAVVSYLVMRGWAVRGGSAFRLASPPFIRICTSTLDAEGAEELADCIAEVLGSGARVPIR